MTSHTQALVLMAFIAAPRPGAAKERGDSARMRGAPAGIDVLRTNTAFVTAVGELELEVVPYTLREDDTQKTGMDAELEYGLLDWLMAEMEVPVLWLATDQGPSVFGLGNIEVAAKALILNTPLRVALNTEIGLPTATDDAFKRRWSVEPSLVGSFSTWAFSAHVEIGAELNEADDWDEIFGNAAVLVHPWDNDVTAALGANFTLEEDDPSFSLLPGVLFELDSLELELGFAAVIGLTPRGEDWGAIGHIEFEL